MLYYFKSDLVMSIATMMLAKILKFKKAFFEDRSVTILGDNMHIDYNYNGNRYTVITPMVLRPRPIIGMHEVSGDDNVDIMDKLRQYMGPYGNFHGIPTTPKMLGSADDIKVKYRNNIEVTYKPTDVISVLCTNVDRVVDI